MPHMTMKLQQVTRGETDTINEQMNYQGTGNRQETPMNTHKMIQGSKTKQSTRDDKVKQETSTQREERRLDTILGIKLNTTHARKGTQMQRQT